MTECCESIVEICFTIFSGSGFFTVLLYAPSMAKLRDEEFNFCNKIVILNVTVHSWLWLCASKCPRERGMREGNTERVGDIQFLPRPNSKEEELVDREVKCPKSVKVRKRALGKRKETVWVPVCLCAVALYKLTAEDNPLAVLLSLL